MTLTRIVRMAAPLALVALAITACSSSSSGDAGSATTSPATSKSATPQGDVTQTRSASPLQSAIEAESPTTPSNASASVDRPGSYIALDEYEGAKGSYAETDVVLFFNAAWCSTCKQARDNITADLSTIPAGLTIVTVDYDSAGELKQKYGVTIQHTYVQIDEDGNPLAKWSGSVTAAEIAEKTV
ncbi:MAG: thioredoxin [Actinobacteria bacterium]|uniref:Unannotated protein n=1 Tax=freshwater metagenome TaxID=449393 RepID=A0A6J7L268_9ZZZZ|nr:thioredoxin [Actinomycetota bacterium]